MNKRMIWFMLGEVLMIVGALMIAPLVVALFYKEDCYTAFIQAIVLAELLGGAMMLLSRPKDKTIYAKEGFIIVAFSWILLSAVGATPFVFSGDIPSYIDAFFETASGFTTTGSSILTDVESLSHGILFWRSLTHWIGGMGVIVFMMAVVPAKNNRNMHVMRAEVPGPSVGKLVPRLRDTAKILYRLYLAISVLELILLLFGGMSLFEALVHMFGTAGTGGFGIKADSIAGYNTYLQWVITIFMLIFGINFNLYYLIWTGHTKDALKSEEMRTFLLLWLLSTLVITVNIFTTHEGFGDAFTKAGFQVASIMSTSGFATEDFNLWPGLSKMILFMLMFIGGCAGSTGGGFKLARVMMLGKAIKREFRHLLHPRTVGVIKFEGKTVDDNTVSGVTIYLGLCFFLLAATILLLSFDKMDTETNITAAVSCFNNIGPGLGAIIGPAGSFAEYSGFSKLVLSAAMLLGRLEIYPLLIAFTPSTWKKSM